VNNNCILTPEDVMDIYRRCHAGEKQSDIAKDHVISQATVSGIKRGEYWNNITGHPRRRPLTPGQLTKLAIYDAYWVEKLPVKEIAVRFGVSKNTVYDIRNGTTAAHITGHPIRKAA
jgi:hypothetical protein